MISQKLTKWIVAAVMVFPIYWLFNQYYNIGIYPLFNSDHAIHALMAEDFDWSRDWYYWGQNRLGSFVPLVGSFFVFIGLSPMLAMSMVQYILLQQP